MLVAPAFLIAATALQAAQPNQLTPEQIAEGWINLFDGETLFGWQPTSDANWKVEDGAITVSEGEQGFLMTTAEFANYILEFEFKAPDTTNSGLFFRTPLAPTNPASDCYEFNIAPADNPFPTGSIVGRKKVLVVTNPPIENQSTASPAWQKVTIDANSRNVAIILHDQDVIYSLTAETPRRGHIGLQFREGPVAFRNIRMIPMGLRPMGLTENLNGWNTDKAEASNFEVTPEEELHVTNGRGQLESNRSYGDFVMRFDCRVDGDALNSGVFYRCIPGEFMNGYECQIHNAYKDGNPTKPADFGTGGIYRRVPARKVVSKDHEWFTMTLVPTGPHVSVWVDGYQVTDWTDDRPEHENPRNGLRTKPGTVAIQGHDPTTNLRFRNLRIAELPFSRDPVGEREDKTNHDDTKNTTENVKK